MSFVYFIRDESQKAIKIGTSVDPSSRLRTLQCANARPLSLVVAIKGTVKDERRLHGRFRKSRLAGEWFAADGEVGTFVEQLQSMTEAEQADAIRESVRVPPSQETIDRYLFCDTLIKAATFKFIRDTGVVQVAAALNAVWGTPLKRVEVFPKTVQALLDGTLYYRSEWLISFMEWSPLVRAAVSLMLDKDRLAAFRARCES